MGWKTVGRILFACAASVLIGCSSEPSVTVAGGMVGQVQTVEGQPAVGATVTIPGTPFGAITDGTGSFALRSVPNGAWTLAARPANPLDDFPGARRLVAVNSDEITDVGVIKLFEPSFVSGTVLVEGSADGALVGIFEEGSLTTAFENGTYLLSKVPPGTHEMVAVLNGASVTLPNVEVAPNEVKRFVDFNFANSETLPARIEGTARFVLGTSEGISVALLDAKTGEIVGEQDVDEDGAFAFEDVALGAYVVRAKKDDTANQASIPSGILAAGRTLTVNLVLSSGDADGDGVADDSDPDIDNDGCLNVDDLFPYDPNECLDADGDGVGDKTDLDTRPDTDRDGVEDADDSNPADSYVCSDLDGDGCDDCASMSFDPQDDGPDSDGDGRCDLYEAVVGYYNVATNNGSASQEAPITAVGSQAVNVGPLAVADLSQYQVLFFQNDSNSGYGNAYTTNLTAITTFVSNGGVFVFHDRAVSAATGDALPGNPGTFARSVDEPGGVDNDINVLRPTVVSNGPSGPLDNNSLDGGNSSSHGHLVASTAPDGAVGILSETNPDYWVVFSYPVGKGYVVYSTIPLDFYLAGQGTIEAFANLYAPNIVAYAAQLAGQLAGR